MNLRVSFCHHIVILMGVNSIIVHMTHEQRSAFRQAGELVRRNDPGDREKAFKALSAAFEEVYEIPYWNQAQAITSAESSSGETR